MELTVDAVLAVAPDEAAAVAGRKLAFPAHWQSLGRTGGAIWGECRGSTLYRVLVNAADLSARCSCPSRKLPCKHSLALLLLAAGDAAIAESDPPFWVAGWLARRVGTAKQTTGTDGARPTAGDDSHRKRIDQRAHLVRQGLDALDRFMGDLMRNGLAGLDAHSTAVWHEQGARLVDAKAPALASRVRRLAAIPGSGPDWPERLLDALGRISLLLQAYRHLERLDPLLQEDVRALIGWSLKEAEVIDRGEQVIDRWATVGRSVEEDERLRTLRSWLVGVTTGRPALVLQFAAGSAPFTDPLPLGSCLDAVLCFWPGAYPQRALIQDRLSAPFRFHGDLPGAPTIEGFLNGVAAALARQPWIERFPCILNDVTPIPAESDRWHVRDRDGKALPLARGEYWTALALSGGAPLTLTGEWTGDRLRPFGVVSGDRFFYPIAASRT